MSVPRQGLGKGHTTNEVRCVDRQTLMRPMSSFLLECQRPESISPKFVC